MVEIIGDMVTLREATEKDIDELYYWKYEEREQAAKKWNGPYIPEKMMTKEQYREMQAGNHELFPHVPHSLIIDVDGKLIGNVGSHWVDKHTNWLETGIVIYDKHFWNGGYGSEAYKLWIDFLFESTGIHRLGMSTWSGNKRMMRAAEKVGMQVEARVRKARMVDGKYFDAIKMGILREEWESLEVSDLENDTS